MARTPSKWTRFFAAAAFVVLGMIAGRAFFPVEVPKPFIVEKVKLVEVPVERVIEKPVPFEVIKYVDRVVEMRVEVPVEKIVYRDIPSGVQGSRTSVQLAAWRSLSHGQSKSQVIAALGHPVRIRTCNGTYEEWYYTGQIASTTVTFFNDGVYAWSEP